MCAKGCPLAGSAEVAREDRVGVGVLGGLSKQGYKYLTWS